VILLRETNARNSRISERYLLQLNNVYLMTREFHAVHNNTNLSPLQRPESSTAQST